MDKEFILGHLKEEHLADHPKLLEICEVSGIETVRQLLMNYEQEQFYVPRISTIKPLMEEVVKENKGLSERALKSKTGLPLKIIRNIIFNVKKKCSS